MGSSPISATIGPLVKRLRHRPFTAVTGVRFSHGSPKRKPRQSAWFFRFGAPCLIENAKCKALCGSSHSPPEDRRARSSGVGCANIRRRRNSPNLFRSAPRQSAWFFRFGDPCIIEKAKCKALCGSSHFASKAMGARSREPRAKIFATGEILPLFFHSATTPIGVVFSFW